MSRPAKEGRSEENEEYRIVGDDVPGEDADIMEMHRIAIEKSEEVLKAFGIHDGAYNLSRINKDTMSAFFIAAHAYSGEAYSRKDLNVIESRARAYNARSIVTPEDIRRLFAKRPDLGIIRVTQGVMQIFGSIRENSDIPLLDHGEGCSIMSEEEKEVMRSMMEYRNRVFTCITVDRPAQEEVDSWIRLFMDLLARMYLVANGRYNGGN